MDSITEFISQSIDKINKDKLKINSISEDQLAEQIDIQF